MDRESVGFTHVVLVGPLWIVALVVAVAGLWKLARPDAAVAAVGALTAGRLTGSGVGPVVVRCLGAAEVGLAVVVVARGGRLGPALLGAAYLAFAFVAERLRRAPGAPSCGCFGRASTPPSRLHVVTNLSCAAVAAAAVAVGPPGLAHAWADLPAAGLPHVLAVLAGAACVVALLTVVAEVAEIAASGRPAAGRPRPGHVVLFGPTIPRKATTAGPEGLAAGAGVRL